MGSASSRKRRRKANEAQSSAPPPPSNVPVEELATEPYVPPRGVTLGLLAATIVAAGYFAAEGVARARIGEGEIASTLLRVEARAEPPQGFELSSLKGEKISLDAYRDKVVFINFWATWCPPCVEEMPSMRRLSQKFADDPRFVMLAVSADDEWAPVRTFFEDDKPPFDVLLDAGGDLAKKYGTEKFPETYVLVDGKIVGFIMGPRDWDTWYAESYLRSLLASR